jgi:pimeloyl-ACP methyl ester carboxylesterase
MHRLAFVIALVAACASAGCGKARYRADGEHAAIRYHAMFSDRAGLPLDPASDAGFIAKDGPGSFRHYVDDALSHMDAYFASGYAAGGADASAVRTRKILIHVHGGLNSFGSALANSQNLYQRIMGDQDFADRYYPFFICWNSDGLSTYGEHLFEVSQGEYHPVLNTAISPISAAVDIASGIVSSPITWWRQTFSIDLPAGLGMDYLDKHDVAAKNPRILRDYGLDIGMGRTDRDFSDLSWSFAKYWVTFPFKLVSNPLACGMGKSAWDMMLRRTDNIFHVPGELQLDDEGLRSIDAKGSHMVAQGTAAVFIEHLENHLRAAGAADPGIRYEITVVGHSMGAIVLNQVLTVYPDLPIRRIIYMAPACSISDAAASVVPFVKRRNATARPPIDARAAQVPDGGSRATLRDRAGYTQFYLLTLAPQAEKSEASGYELLPRGSLLEWIDNFYSTPPSAVDRTLGTWENIVSAVNPFLPIGGDIHIKSFGWRSGSEPSTHGSFNRCPFWKESFRSIPPTPEAVDVDHPLYYSEALR